LQRSVGSRAFQKERQQKQFKKQAERLLSAAAVAYRQGKQSDIQALCGQILKNLPYHVDALQLLGVSQSDCRQFGEAERTLGRAVSIAPPSGRTLRRFWPTVVGSIWRWGSSCGPRPILMRRSPSIPR
jgi:hypothetical protein